MEGMYSDGWQYFESKFINQMHELERTELLKITRQGISWRYTEYKLNTYYC